MRGAIAFSSPRSISGPGWTTTGSWHQRSACWRRFNGKARRGCGWGRGEIPSARGSLPSTQWSSIYPGCSLRRVERSVGAGEAEGADQAVDVRARDIEALGGLLHVPAGLAQGVDQEPLLELAGGLLK